MPCDGPPTAACALARFSAAAPDTPDAFRPRRGRRGARDPRLRWSATSADARPVSGAAGLTARAVRVETRAQVSTQVMSQKIFAQCSSGGTSHGVCSAADETEVLPSKKTARRSDAHAHTRTRHHTPAAVPSTPPPLRAPYRPLAPLLPGGLCPSSPAPNSTTHNQYLRYPAPTPSAITYHDVPSACCPPRAETNITHVADCGGHALVTRRCGRRSGAAEPMVDLSAGAGGEGRDGHGHSDGAGVGVSGELGGR